jgi:hypothetical protein
MENIFQSAIEFLNANDINTLEYRRELIMNTLMRYRGAVLKTLDSIKMIEESLKKFKKNKALEGESDEFKIRFQIKIDCESFESQSKSLGVDLENNVDYKELRTIIENSLQ